MKQFALELGSVLDLVTEKKMTLVGRYFPQATYLEVKKKQLVIIPNVVDKQMVCAPASYRFISSSSAISPL